MNHISCKNEIYIIYYNIYFVDVFFLFHRLCKQDGIKDILLQPGIKPRTACF